jgi:hypothetical protein
MCRTPGQRSCHPSPWPRRSAASVAGACDASPDLSGRAPSRSRPKPGAQRSRVAEPLGDAAAERPLPPRRSAALSTLSAVTSFVVPDGGACWLPERAETRLAALASRRQTSGRRSGLARAVRAEARSDARSSDAPVHGAPASLQPASRGPKLACRQSLRRRTVWVVPRTATRGLGTRRCRIRERLLAAPDPSRDPWRLRRVPSGGRSPFPFGDLTADLHGDTLIRFSPRVRRSALSTGACSACRPWSPADSSGVAHGPKPACLTGCVRRTLG